MMTIKDVAAALTQASDYFNWEHQYLDDFHRYAHKFGGEPGGNVLHFLLEDALRLRGLTLEQFRAEKTECSIRGRIFNTIRYWRGCLAQWIAPEGWFDE